MRIATTAGLTLGVILIASSGAAAFNCSLPEGPRAPYALHAKPNAKSQVLAWMPAGGSIKQLPGRGREVGGSFTGEPHWTYVQWQPAEPKAKGRRGWIDREKTHGGECED